MFRGSRPHRNTIRWAGSRSRTPHRCRQAIQTAGRWGRHREFSVCMRPLCGAARNHDSSEHTLHALHVETARPRPRDMVGRASARPPVRVLKGDVSVSNVQDAAVVSLQVGHEQIAATARLADLLAIRNRPANAAPLPICSSHWHLRSVTRLSRNVCRRGLLL